MKSRSAIVLVLSLSVVLGAVPGFGQSAERPSLIVPISKVASPEVESILDKAFYDYHVFEVDFAEVDSQVRSLGRLNLYLGNQGFDLELEENDLRGPDYRQVTTVDGVDVDLGRGPVTTFKGRVVGDPESSVRLSVTPELLTGSIWTEGEWIFLDPVADYHREAGITKRGRMSTELVVYRDKNIKKTHDGACAVTHKHDFNHLRTMLPGARSELLDALGIDGKTHQFRTLEVATEYDGQYSQRYGSGANSRINGILNDVEGVIYVSELNLGINVVFQQAWTNLSTDPYTSLSASTTLTQMRNWWNANRGGVSRDVAHQFSGKDFSGGTIGIAFVGVVCTSPSNSYGISQDVSGTAARRRLTAHEIGHNLSANHDSGGGCNGNGPIMCPSIQTGGSSAADDFSNASLNSIDNHIDSFGGCI